MRNPVKAVWHPEPAPPGLGAGKEVPDRNAGLVARVLFTWLSPLMAVGWTRPIETNDLYTMDKDRTAHVVGDRLERNFYARCEPDRRPAHLRPHLGPPGQDEGEEENKPNLSSSAPDLEKGTEDEKKKEKKSKYDQNLLMALSNTFAWTFWSSSFFYIIASGLQTTTPLVTKALLIEVGKIYGHHLDPVAVPDQGSFAKGIGLAVGLFAMQEIASLANNQYFIRAMATGFLVRTSVISFIFRKALRLSNRARLIHSTGQITTMISSDCTRLDNAAGFVHIGWIGVIQIVVAIALLISDLGVSALVALAVLVLGVPIQAIAINRMILARRGAVKITDRRVRLMQEIFQGIRLLVLFGWQSPFAERVAGLRMDELKQVRKYAFYRAGITAFVSWVPVAAATLSFVTYSLVSPTFDVAVIFSSLQYLNILRQPLLYVPLIASACGDAYVAQGRITKVLLADEMQDVYSVDDQSKYSVRIDGDFTWERGGSAAGEAKSNKNGKKPFGKGGFGGRWEEERTEETKEEKRKRVEAEKKKKAEAKERKKKAKAAKKEGRDLEEEERLHELEKAPPPFELRDVSLRVPTGFFVAVVGKVGSGKSSLLQAMAGEMRRTRGEVVFGGTVAYAAQSPWVQNMSLRDNVLFGRPDDQLRFDRVVEACALRADIDMLPDGEQTEIGEKGVTLSGGQKARVNLARAAYFDADIVLLDDPLSAVDSHVSKHIVENCLLRGPMADKTRILVTHQLHVLPHTDMVLFVDDGRITEQGTYKELISRGGAFAKLIEEFGSADEAQDPSGEEGERAGDGDGERGVKKAMDGEEGGKGKKGAALMTTEERAQGAVSGQIYAQYLRAAGSLGWAPVLFLFLTLSQVAQVGNTLILGFWSSGQIPGFTAGQYMGLYAGLGFAQAVFTFFASFSFSVAGFFASYRLFVLALGGVLGSPMAFFDTTPVGRVISRLSKDVDILDVQLPQGYYQLLSQFASVFGTIGLTIWAYNWLGLMFPPLFLLYFFFGAYYRRTSREAKRLDSLLRSFLYATYNETLTGLATVRAFREQDRFIRVTEANVDVENRAYYITIALQRWLSVRMDLLGNLLVLGIGLMAVGVAKSHNPAKLGVVLTYALSITQLLGQMVQQLATVEQDMNSVERILHYSDLPQEGPSHTPQDPPPPWPSKGAIEFDDVQLRYRDGLPLVLKGLSFRIEAGEHVGIVGRTGAGKSSLLAALFRSCPLAGGTITVDGVDTSTIGLETLRHNLSIIPQDAVLFDGTLRYNLDPLGKYTDTQLYAALRRVELIDKIPEPMPALTRSLSKASAASAGAAGHPMGRFSLDAMVTDESFSAGEKQLVALCRVLVKDSRVLVLDEATSSTDVETDNRVQKMIQEDFGDKTLVCIAHRLNTIVFYDRIICMDAGRVAEFDTPLALFDREDSIFRSMCDSAGLTREDITRIRAGAAEASEAGRNNRRLSPA